MLPHAPLPDPHSCSDSGSFAEKTLLTRLPVIARRVIQENDFAPEVNRRLEALIHELPDARIRELVDPGAPDLHRWERYLRPWLGRTWRQLSFLGCEMYLYRRILEATGYFQAGSTHWQDPYIQQKALGYSSTRETAAQMLERLDHWREPTTPLDQAFYEAIETNLWGNRADLSLWPVGDDGKSDQQLHQADDFLLVNDLWVAASHIVAQVEHPSTMQFMVDNSGLELVYDLALADLLLSRNAAHQVIFHVKGHPTFVSDAIKTDVSSTIRWLANEGDAQRKELGKRLQAYTAARRLVVRGDFFWNAPMAFWQMPAHLQHILSSACLVICKGDANYRRLMGDLRWPDVTPFEQVVNYFPAPLLALRASKSEVMVGLAPGQALMMDQREADWRTNGCWGLVQFRQ